jgi:hypothetical protein
MCLQIHWRYDKKDEFGGTPCGCIIESGRIQWCKAYDEMSEAGDDQELKDLKMICNLNAKAPRVTESRRGKCVNCYTKEWNGLRTAEKAAEKDLDDSDTVEHSGVSDSKTRRRQPLKQAQEDLAVKDV